MDIRSCHCHTHPTLKKTRLLMWSTQHCVVYPHPYTALFPCASEPLLSATLYQPLGPQSCRTHSHPRAFTFAIASPWSLSVTCSEKASSSLAGAPSHILWASLSSFALQTVGGSLPLCWAVVAGQSWLALLPVVVPSGVWHRGETWCLTWEGSVFPGPLAQLLLPAVCPLPLHLELLQGRRCRLPEIHDAT